MINFMLGCLNVIDLQNTVILAKVNGTHSKYCTELKRLRNGQLHISTNGHKAISLCQAQSTNFVSLFLLSYLSICNISHTEVIFSLFGTGTSIKFWCN